MVEPIRIDGSRGEGGGQILRTSLALAALLGQPVVVDNIRANRPQPGLKTQHLAGVTALAAITAAEVQGARKHSTGLVFAPGKVQGGRYRFEISTAGAATMLLAAVLPPLLLAPQPSEVTITGGTHVPFSPPFHYLDRIFLPALRKLGGEVNLELVRWGFYPKGGGTIRAHVRPGRGLQGVRLENRGRLAGLKFFACSSRDLPAHIGRREIDHMEQCLPGYKDRISSETVDFQADSPGNFVFLQAAYEHAAAGFSALGKRGRPAEEVAAEACRAFRKFDRTAATVDRHLADQIILYLALARGESSFITEELTSHLLTNIDIIRVFLPADIRVDAETGRVRVTGVGMILNP